MSPFHAICPISRTGFAFGDVFRVSLLKSSTFLFHCLAFTRLWLACCFGALLAKSNQPILAAVFDDNSVGFTTGMTRGADRLVVAIENMATTLDFGHQVNLY